MKHDRLTALWDVDNAKEFGPVSEMSAARVTPKEVHEFCRRWHYSNTGGNMTWNYGLFDGWTLVGVIAFNLPTMETCASFFGRDHWEWVVHMGRLVCADNAPRNTESRLISLSLKLLVKDRPVCRAVVTYAAQSQNHVGYVYQATNALYLGQTSANLHYIDQLGQMRSSKQGTHVSIEKALARGWTVQKDAPKHRYLYLLGSKSQRKEAMKKLLLPTFPYPKETKKNEPTP